MRTPTRTLLVIALAGLVALAAAVDAGLRVGDSEGIATTPAPAPTPDGRDARRPGSDPGRADGPAVAIDRCPGRLATQGGPVFTLDPDKPPQSGPLPRAAVNDIQSYWRAVYPRCTASSTSS